MALEAVQVSSARTNRTPKKQQAFLDALAERGNVKDACDAVGVGRRTVYEWRDADPVFAAGWDDALDHATDIMEREGWRRAVEGDDKPVFGSLGNNMGSGEVGRIREYSDTLLIFLLKAARPNKYRDKTRDEPLPPVDWDRVSEADQVAFIEGKISLADVIKRQQPRS